LYIELETERLRIRPIRVTDALFIEQLVNSDGWLTFIGDKKISTITDAENYIQKILGQPYFYYNVFELKKTGQAIGIVTLITRENRRHPDIGFALLPDFEKNGYALEASKMYLKAIVQSNLHKKIIAITLTHNHKSINLLTKLGLDQEIDFEEENERYCLFSLSIV